MIIRQIFNPPNWFTSASLFCGLYAIILAGQANGDPDYFYKAGLMVFFAGLFDALDGRVARMTGTGSQFGVQLDSLVDLISFGVAPACIVFFWGLQPFGTAGVLVSGLLMLAGAFRLARFNVLADGKAHKYSMGLTITLGGGTVAAVVMCFAGNAMGPPENAAWIVAFVVCVALLEISDVPFRTMKTFRLSPPYSRVARGGRWRVPDHRCGVRHLRCPHVPRPPARRQRPDRGAGDLPPEAEAAPRRACGGA